MVRLICYRNRWTFITWPVPTHRPLAELLADQLRADRDALTTRWLERIATRVTVAPNRIFPSQDLLDHVPRLITGVADYIEHPDEDVGTDMPVISKARELGALRHQQGFDAYEILKEFEIFGNVVFAHVTHIIETIDVPCTRGELMRCMHRIFQAIVAIQQATTSQFLELSAVRTREREDRLRGFNRLVSHELKNTVHAIIGAHAMLQESFIVGAERDRFMDIIGRNAQALQVTLANLLNLSRIESDVRQHKNILVDGAVAEVVRQLRDAASAAGVKVVLHRPFPEIEVNAAVVELCLTNYLSNAIKYSDPAKPERVAEISAWIDADAVPAAARSETTGEREAAPSPPGMLIIEVRDNGLGVPESAAARMFERFFRAHTHMAPNISGTGLGLNLVRETVQAIGGDAWAKANHPSGTVFGISIPCRRAEDRAEQ